ncbi:MAG: tetratricopeptide repeat protein [Terracidiphilus sp.]
MHPKSLRNRFFWAAITAVVLVSLSAPARAASKEIIELQTQVQQLLDMVQRLQTTMDTRFAVLQHLAEQTADNASQMSATVNTLQQKIAAQSDTAGGKLDAVSGQMQSLNDSVDELKSHIAKLDKTIQDMQAQLQNVQNPPPAVIAGPVIPGGAPAATGVTAPQAPPLKETFQAGVRDYNAAKFDVASGEFQDVIHYYPLDDLAGAAQFYLGEIAYHQSNYADAVKAYNAVLDGFPGSAKAPAAQLRKGLSLLQLNRKTEAIAELKLLVKRHPQTPEAAQAKTKLATLGVHSAPR